MQITIRLLREPLLHFLAIGVVLFAINILIRSSGTDRGDYQRISVTSAEIAWLEKNFRARWLRPPTENELHGLVDDFVRREVLYREALAMGLDRDDEVIRRRLVQKIEFMTEDLAAQVQPTEAELQSYFQENLQDYRIPERRSFIHIYFDLDRGGQQAISRAERLLADLQTSPDSAIEPGELGDRFMLEHAYEELTQQEVERLFGDRFAASLFASESGTWHGPVASGYGLHLVRVTAARDSTIPEFSAVRDDVLRDHAVTVKQQAREAMFSTLAEKYVIEVDEVAIEALVLSADPEVRNQ